MFASFKKRWRFLLYSAAILVVHVPLHAQSPVNAKQEKAKLQGTWQAVAWLDDGEKESDEVLQYIRWTFKADTLFSTKALTVTICGKRTVKGQGGTVESTFNIHPEKMPKVMITKTVRPFEGIILKSIYSLDGDTLKVCASKQAEKGLPADFTAPKGSGRLLITLKKKADSK